MSDVLLRTLIREACQEAEMFGELIGTCRAREREWWALFRDVTGTDMDVDPTFTSLMALLLALLAKYEPQS